MRITRLTLFFTAALAIGACKPTEQPVPVAEPIASASVVSFTATPTEVEPGEPVTLRWEVKNATQVAITTASGAAVALPSATAQQGEVVVPVPTSTIFVLTAYGEGGKDSAIASVVTRGESPTMLFAAVPPQVTAGESATLMWNVPGAQEVVITSAGTELHRTASTTGTFSVTPGFTSTFTLTAGDRSADVEVRVLPAIVAFAASTASVMPGGQVVLSWKVGGASSVRLEAEGRGELYSATSEAEIADGTFEDIVPATLPLSGVVKYTLTAEQAGSLFSKVVSVWVGADPRIVSAKIPEFAKEGGNYVIAWEVALADRVEVSVGGDVIYAALTPATTAQGSLTLATPTAPTEVVLRATNQVGGISIHSGTVNPVGVPTFNSFTVTPDTLAQGGSPVTLSWDVTNARTARISDKSGRLIRVIKGFGAEVATIDTYPNENTTFFLSGDNQVGDKFGPYAVNVKVQSPARLDFTPQPVLAGEQSQLTGHSLTNGGDIIGLAGAPVTGSSNLFSGVMNQTGDAFVDIAKTGSELIPQYYDYYYSVIGYLPETFSTLLFNNRVSAKSVTVNVNGAFFFDPTNYQYSYWYPEKISFPSTTLSPLTVSPWYDDLLYVPGTSKMHYRLETVGSEQRLIVQWTNMTYDGVPSSRLTFQAQLYSSGHVVFAYQRLEGLPGNASPAVGVVNSNETQFAVPPQRPVVGDTVHLFGPVTLPFDVTATAATAWLNVMMGSDGDYITVDANPDMYRAGDFYIGEVHYDPDLVAAPNGEWIEIVNSMSRSVVLDGWTVSFNGVNHTIPAGTNLTLPANGVLVLAESNDPLLNGGITPDYTYGPGFALPTSGSVTLLKNTIQFSRSAWNTTSGGGPGKSVVIDPNYPDHLPFNQNPACAGTGTFGTQTGSPGVTQQRCFPYRIERLTTGEFEAIAATGVRINGSQVNAFAVNLTANATTLPPIKWGRKTYDLISVSDNGYIALRDSAVEAAFSCTGNSTCYNSNKSSPSTTAPTRLIAPYWDNVRSDSLSNSGIYTLRKDPDGTAGTGDEHTIISWEGWMSEYGNYYTMDFQVKFFDSGMIEFHYNNNGQYYSIGSAATSWLESEDGRFALRHNVNSQNPGTRSGTGVRFHYIP